VSTIFNINLSWFDVIDINDNNFIKHVSHAMPPFSTKIKEMQKKKKRGEYMGEGDEYG